MSEYQYYEFLAIDGPLTQKEQAKLRKVSSRACITSTRFAVDYSWSDFRGSPSKLMDEYFDAFLYFASWGTRRLAFRVPREHFPLEAARRYHDGENTTIRTKGDNVIIDLLCNFEGEDEWGGGEDAPGGGGGLLSQFLPIREQLACGDLRALYLAWLAGPQLADSDHADADILEPPCPPGLARLDPALEAFTEMFLIDPALIAAAAEASPDLSEQDVGALRAWVEALPEPEKTALLLDVLDGRGTMQLRAGLVRRFQAILLPQQSALELAPRTVGALHEAAKALRARQRGRKRR